MLKIYWFSFSNQITRVLVVQVCLTEVQTKTLFTYFFVQFCMLTSAVTYYIVFIHERFCCAQLQVFSHI